MKIQKGQTVILVLVGILVLIVGGAYYFSKFQAPKDQLQNSVVTSQTPQPTITAQSTKDNETSLKEEIINYKINPSWSTYTDNKAKFTIQYPSKFKVSDQNKDGEAIYILNCGSADLTSKEICTRGYEITIYNDYDQGSRREWVNKKFVPYKPYYLNWIIDGRKALVVIEGNPAGSSDLLIVIPNGSKMVVYSTGFVSWDPDSNKLPDLTFHKNILSTFRFD